MRDSHLRQRQVCESVFAELTGDTTFLHDPDAADSRAAVPVTFERDKWGDFEVSVQLKDVQGAQLWFVLLAARKHELDVREQHGWLVLSPVFDEDDDEQAEPEPDVELREGAVHGG